MKKWQSAPCKAGNLIRFILTSLISVCFWASFFQISFETGSINWVNLRKAGYTGTIIALTAHAMSTDRAKCLDAGCDDYMTKPVDPKTLASMVSKYASDKELLSATGG